MPKLTSLPGGRPPEEPRPECPWCGSRKHIWSACLRVREFAFFGEYEGVSDLERVVFHSPEDLESVLELMGAIDDSDSDEETSEPGPEEGS